MHLSCNMHLGNTDMQLVLNATSTCTCDCRVFLGNRQYFVSSDVGGGKMQWYAFHNEPQGGKDEEGMNKTRLLQIFGHWCDNVVDLIKATPEVGGAAALAAEGTCWLLLLRRLSAMACARLLCTCPTTCSLLAGL